MFSLLLLTRQFQYCNNWHCSNLMFCLGAFQAVGVLVKGLWAGFAEALSQQACKSRALDFVVGHESSSERSCEYCTYTKMTLFVKCHHLLTYLCPSCQHGYRKIKECDVWRSAGEYKTTWIGAVLFLVLCELQNRSFFCGHLFPGKNSAQNCKQQVLHKTQLPCFLSVVLLLQNHGMRLSESIGVLVVLLLMAVGDRYAFYS